MKTLLILAVLGTATIAQAAPEQPASGSVNAQVVSGTRYRLNDSEFAVYKGRYQTDHGGTVTVSQQANKFYAQIEGKAPIEILAAGPDSFISRDGRTKVDFRLNDNGDLMEVAVSAVANTVASVSAR